MRFGSLIGQSAKNAFRSKSRTALTVIAIFIGAFTLTITSGIGTGVNRYIDSSIASIGADDTLTITKLAETAAEVDEGPQEYNPDQLETESSQPRPGVNTVVVEPLTSQDFTDLAAIDNVLRVEPLKPISVLYIQGESETPYVVQVGALVEGMQLTLAAGDQLDDTTTDYQVAVAESYLDALGFTTAEDALGERVAFGVKDVDGETQIIEATVTAVTQPGFGPGADNSVPNKALKDAIYSIQVGDDVVIEDQDFASATLWFDLANMTEADIDALKADLDEAGFEASSTEDALGTFTSVVDAIILVLNAFAIIALIAAGFGIVNTLFMSVQERTREIGLMKAMGLSGSKVFGLFSLEAVVIGLLGSLLGVGIGMAVGTAVSAALSRTIFSELAGLELVAFDAVSVASVVAIVAGIAFVAGASPAIKAARKDPIEALRYE